MVERIEPWLASLHHVLTFPLLELANGKITALSLLAVGVTLLVTLQASKVAQRGIRAAAQRRKMKLDDGSVAVAQRLAHYSVLIVGLFIGLQSMGIDLGALIAAGAVFAVGVGLAMQNLAQNFVSGLILLVEQTIKPGDVVEVEGRTARVKSMGIRSTVALCRDGEDVIIPNSLLVQGIVRNFTLSDRAIRVRVPVGVHYDSDLGRAREVLLAAARSQTWRTIERDPVLLLCGFGSSSVDFEISVWAEDPWRLPQWRTDLAFAVWDALHEANIVIAYPQVDVHFDPPATRALTLLAGGEQA